METIKVASREINGTTFTLQATVVPDHEPVTYPVSDLILQGDTVVIRSGYRAYEQDVVHEYMITDTGPDLCTDLRIDGAYQVERPSHVDGSWFKASARIRQGASFDGSELIVWRKLTDFYVSDDHPLDKAIANWREHVTDIASGNLSPWEVIVELHVTHPDGSEETREIDRMGSGWWESGTSMVDIAVGSGAIATPDSDTAHKGLNREIKEWIDYKRARMNAAMTSWADADRIRAAL
jgi:hypothetical protein